MKETRLQDIIIQLRRMHNLTQEELAERAEVNVRTIQRLEKDGSHSPETLRGVADAFDLDCKVLLALAALPPASPEDEKYITATLAEMTTGKALADCFGSVHVLQPDHPEEMNDEQSSVVGELLDYFQDYLDIRSDLTPSQNIAEHKNLREYLTRLRIVGLRVFAASVKREFRFRTGAPSDWNTAVVLIVPAEDPRIQSTPAGPVILARLEKNPQFRL